MQFDPMEGEGSCNYLFCANDPVGNVDPRGLMKCGKAAEHVKRHKESTDHGYTFQQLWAVLTANPGSALRIQMEKEFWYSIGNRMQQYLENRGDATLTLGRCVEGYYIAGGSVAAEMLPIAGPAEKACVGEVIDDRRGCVRQLSRGRRVAYGGLAVVEAALITAPVFVKGKPGGGPRGLRWATKDEILGAKGHSPMLRGLGRLKNSRRSSMPNVRKRWWGGRSPFRENPLMPRGREYKELSHVYISQDGRIGKHVPGVIKNRGWNLKPMWGSEHALVDPSRHRFMSQAWRTANPLPGPVTRFWGRVPTSHKVAAGAGAVSAGGYVAYELWDEPEH